MPASSGVRSRLRRLHGRHAAATFSHTCSPPRLRGTTWSIESAWPPQYWHRWPSGRTRRAATSAVRRWYGTLTMYRRRMTIGVGTLEPCAEWSSVPSSWSRLGLVGQHQADGAADRHDAERLVGRIEDERAPHGAGTYRSTRLRAGPLSRRGRGRGCAGASCRSPQRPAPREVLHDVAGDERVVGVAVLRHGPEADVRRRRAGAATAAGATSRGAPCGPRRAGR